MNSAILWPERTPIDSSMACKLDYVALFTDYCILYQVLRFRVRVIVPFHFKVNRPRQPRLSGKMNCVLSWIIL